MAQFNEECKCKNCKGIFTVMNRPGDAEAIIMCQDCGKLWYTMVYERMSFSDSKDVYEEYQIPITMEEYHKIQGIKYEELSLTFLAGRRARVFHEGGVREIDSDFALRRCGKSS